MSGIGRRIKTFLGSIAAPTLFLAFAAYFGWSATQGDRGLQAYALRQTQLQAVQADLRRVEQERDELERRVAGLRSSRLDPDTLDERVRSKLNVVDPADLLVMYPQDKRLF